MILRMEDTRLLTQFYFKDHFHSSNIDVESDGDARLEYSGLELTMLDFIAII